MSYSRGERLFADRKDNNNGRDNFMGGRGPSKVRSSKFKVTSRNLVAACDMRPARKHDAKMFDPLSFPIEQIPFD